MANQKYNVYCDESSIDNPQDNIMVMGGVFVAREKTKEIKDKIAEIKEANGFRGEIKWTKTDKKKISFLKELITYLLELESSVLAFHCITVEKKKVKYDLYHQGDKELAFFKFIYELLEKRLRSNTTYYLFFDYKPTKIRESVLNLRTFLEKHSYFNKEKCIIKHAQAYSSKENIFLQLADLFCGAVGYQKNKKPSKTAKHEISKFIASKLKKKNLCYNSYPSEPKFNIFHIDLDLK